jgi:acetyltransferase-like isoleucine patch superfamily enzyme
MYTYFIYKIHSIRIWFSILITKSLFHILSIQYGKDIKILRQPTIVKHKSAKIILGNSVTLNSDKKYYHLNMFSSVKLVADKRSSIISIGDNTRLNGVCIHAFSEIKIGKNCLVAANTQIIDSNGHLLSMENPENRINTQDVGNPIIIEDNVWIGTGCIILGGANIGSGSVIAANSVVKGEVPANCLYGGNPSKIIKQY